MSEAEHTAVSGADESAALLTDETAINVAEEPGTSNESGARKRTNADYANSSKKRQMKSQTVADADITTYMKSISDAMKQVVDRCASQSSTSQACASNTTADDLFAQMIASELKNVPNGPLKSKAMQEITKILFDLQGHFTSD